MQEIYTLSGHFLLDLFPLVLQGFSSCQSELSGGYL